MDTDAYLRRINWAGPVAVDAGTLRRLHLAHLRAVPFENLSIRWQEPIVLTDDALFEKVVQRRRGGFCYELNGLSRHSRRASDRQRDETDHHDRPGSPGTGH